MQLLDARDVILLYRLQGDSGGLGLGYVDINSISFGGYPETELSQHNPVRDHQNHPVHQLRLKFDPLRILSIRFLGLRILLG